MNLIPKRKLGELALDASVLSDNIQELILGSAVIGTAQIKDASITNAKIGSLAVEDANINTCSISKLTAGNLTVTGTITTGGLTTGATGVTIKSTGINIWGLDSALTTRATEAGTIQCAVNASGQITAGAGKVTLDSTGVTISGAAAATASIFFKDSAGTLQGDMLGSATYGLLIRSENNKSMYLSSGATLTLAAADAVDITGTHVRIPNHATGAASPEEGDLFYDTDINKLKVYTGAAYETITSAV